MGFTAPPGRSAHTKQRTPASARAVAVRHLAAIRSSDRERHLFQGRHVAIESGDYGVCGGRSFNRVAMRAAATCSPSTPATFSPRRTNSSNCDILTTNYVATSIAAWHYARVVVEGSTATHGTRVLIYDGSTDYPAGRI